MNFKEDLKRLLILFMPFTAGLGLMIWLGEGLRFDSETSPGWQFLPYSAGMTLMLLGSAILAMSHLIRWPRKAKILSAWLVLPFQGTFIAWGWVEHGPYENFRDPRILKVVLQASATSLFWNFHLALLQGVILLPLTINHLMGRNWTERLERHPRFAFLAGLRRADSLEKPGVEQ